jgi:DNA-directed RNA polymerase
MLRDPGGAGATNVQPGVGLDFYDDFENDPVMGPLLEDMEDPLGFHRPDDIYQRVVDKVKEKLELGTEEENGSARRLLPHVDRDLLKRPVMTVPYAVTRRGMQSQIHEVLVEKLGAGNYWKECNYLAGLVEEAVDEEIPASKQARDWLKEVARVVTADAGQSLRWASPIAKEEKVEVTVGGQRVRLTLRKDTDKLDKNKHAGAIAPNFVHSCDAAHMLATVRRMADGGITSVAMVHDSFATLAADVNIMNERLRETFVEQYSRNILEEFREEIVSQLPPSVSDKVPPVPALGNFQIEDVLYSEFFFS